MKTFLTKFMVLSSMLLLVISACKKNDLKLVSNGGKSGTLSASATTLVLDKTKANSTDTVITFSFNQASYGFKAAINNVLQIDSVGDNWAKPDTIILSANKVQQGFTTDDFNSILLKLHLKADQASQVQVRVKHSISQSIAPIFTNIVSLTVTPYSNASWIYVPGAYQGWAPATADSLVSTKSDGIYTGIVNFTPGNLDFKITPAKVWDNSYGSTDNKTIIYNGGGNITAPAAGGLLLTVNLNNNTITFAPQWSIIGDGTPGGWGTDTNMEFDVVHNTWFITATLVGDGSKALKFRFANDWTINLGGSGGTLSQNGANIIVPTTPTAGALYKITLDPVANTYTLVKQ